ncbi:MAG: hypothetical protein KGL39_27125 [Patescibacteria group bacterium]|nr:hypothetical protein [Patescibacteria group bacterium]
MEKNTKPIEPQIGEYQGKPVITLKRTAEDKYPFSFGVAKARLIVEHFDAIKKFAADHPAK